MINFPLLQTIDIFNYGLFPGAPDSQNGLHIIFRPGLTLILGANGLGKTTLITIIYRILTGPFDISGISDNSDLGTTRLNPTRISQKAQRIFSDRVVDGAHKSLARLSFQLGAHTIFIERSLYDMSLTELLIDNRQIDTNDETEFQNEIPKMAGISTFGDWILMLRFLVFYFEDRRALVWDPSAQRQILRILFLPPEVANKWTNEERDILILDSRMRNLNAVLTREEQALVEIEEKLGKIEDVRKKLKELEDQQEKDKELNERLRYELLEADNRREHARLRVLNAEQELETGARDIERLKFSVIGKSFPSQSETAKFILAQIFSTQDCLVCGNHVPEIVDLYTTRSQNKQCVICGSDINGNGNTFLPDQENKLDESRIDQAFAHIRLVEIDLNEANIGLQDTNQVYQTLYDQLNEINAGIKSRAVEIEKLVRNLPPEDVEIHKQKSELAVMHTRIEELKEQLTNKRKQFSRFVEDVNRDIANRKDSIKNSFDKYAEGFLLERCELIYSQHKAHIGQSGESIAFPSFELDMSGASFPSPVRRSGPEQVSESQREFIDLGFRMALMNVSSNEGKSTLVMDAPESSLDAVFSSRAANVLSRFAIPNLENRLVITSNFVEGQLIPELINKSISKEDRKDRIIDLINNAAPTAAVRELRKEYDAIRERLLDLK